MELYSDEYFMNEALKEAKKAFDHNEVPVGAVIVSENKIISRAHNLTELLNDVTAHAEMQAITSAANHIGGKYLNECSLFVTLEPCLMCAGALYWTHLTKLIYGASDDKKGFSKLNQPVLHPKTLIKKGVLEKECSSILKEFFALKRK
ncbi:MAG: nucleoside deaminase [Bacteroidota bacterium]|jgi:tRNA(adenine34) deaminase